MIGERPLFDTGAEAAALARKLYPNQGLHPAATAFGLCHPRALQYLEAAPVLVLAGGPPLGGPRGFDTERAHKQRTAYIQHLMRPLCERGAPLKEVMRAFSLAPPLRKLTPFALVPRARTTVARLSAMDPAVLGRIIPATPGAQRTWLSACGEWVGHMQRRYPSRVVRFAWAAEAMALAGVARRDVSTVADFATYQAEIAEKGGLDCPVFNEAWGWPRAAEEAHLWHSRLTVERALQNSPFKPDSVVDLGGHPDLLTEDGYEFHALRTPLAICDEGSVMRHCVATYLNDVVAGDAHIVSMRHEGRRVATVECDRFWIVRQVKRKANALPDGDELTAAGHYAFAVRRQITADRR